MLATMSSGYLYVLANSSMPGLVKIGKTTRLPSERADELSRVTGVATPFIVVYEDYFDDCAAAESFVHTKLAADGHRLADNREFFRAPVSDVVKTIASIQPSRPVKSSAPDLAEGLLTPDGRDFSDFDFNDHKESESHPWDALLEEADRHYYGLEGYIQDYAEAFKLYRDAARLGSPMAYEKLGYMYQHGESVREDTGRALEFYKEGAKKGNYFCYAGMAGLFILKQHAENTVKALRKFIEGGRADGWNSYMEYPGPHIQTISTILFSLSRGPMGPDPEVISTVREYVPAVIISMRSQAEGEWIQAYPDVKQKYLNLIATLQTWI